MIVEPNELQAIEHQASEEYPAECCGVVLRRGGERRLVPCRNVQDALHARDPLRHPRDARTAYYIDPHDLLAIGRAETEGWSVAVIYHSHIDAGAYFSETDRRQALLDDQPTYPEAVYLVASVVAGRVEAVAAFQWDPQQRDFRAVALEGTASSGAERPR